MANLIIKPTSGGSLILQDEGGTAAHTIDANGNHTLSGSTNNLGTVTAGTISTVATIATGVHGKYTLDDYQSFAYETVTSTTTTGEHEINISGSNYITVLTGSSTSDVLEFVMDYGTCFRGCGSNAGYMGFGLTRATNTGFSAGQATIWRSGEHSWGAGAGSSNDFYDNVIHTKLGTVSECGLSASTTYYMRLTGMTHTSAGTYKWGTGSTDKEGTIEPNGLRLTYRRWRLV